MKNIKLIFILSAEFIFVCALLSSFAHAENKEIIFGVTMNPMERRTTFLGKGAADISEFTQNAIDEFKRLYGYTLTPKLYSGAKFLFKAVESKTVDFSPMFLAVYLSAKNQGLPVTPFMAATPFEKGERYCLYVHKDSGIKKAAQLKGKRFASDFPIFMSKKDALPPKESYIYWIAIKKIMQKGGAGNVRFNAFFKEFTALPIPLESVAYAVLLKKFDAFLSNEGYIRSLSNHDKSFSELSAVSCVDVAAGAPFVYRSDVPQDIVKKFKDILLHPPATKTTKQLMKEFKGIKLFPVEEKDYAVYFQWLKEAEQKGWFKEFDDIMKNTPKPAEKKKETSHH